MDYSLPIWPLVSHACALCFHSGSTACTHMQHTHDMTFVHGQDRSLSAIRPSAFGPDPQLCRCPCDESSDWWWLMHIFCIILLEPEVSQGGFLPLSRMSRQSIEFPPYLVKARASTQFPVSSWPLFTFRFPLPFAMVPPSSFNLFNAFQCFSTM